jgi:hypothetical protein
MRESLARPDRRLSLHTDRAHQEMEQRPMLLTTITIENVIRKHIRKIQTIIRMRPDSHACTGNAHKRAPILNTNMSSSLFWRIAFWNYLFYD